MDAADALAQALMLRPGDSYAIVVLADLAAAGYVVVHLPTVEQAADAICHQRFDPSGRHREDRDAAAVLDLIRNVHPCWTIRGEVSHDA